MLTRICKGVGAICLWAIVLICLIITIAPAFLDRIYYSGPISAHYDGAHFDNPDGEINMPTASGKGGNMLGRFLLSQASRPPWPDHVEVHPNVPPAHVNGTAMRATWVGHATVLIQADGLNILTDPIWSDRAGPMAGLGPKRVAAPGINFAALPKIDVVLVSHNHYDHMDLPTLKRLWDRDRPLIITSLGNDTIIKGAGVPSRALDWGGMTQLANGAKVHVVRNHHWSSRWGKDKNRALWSAFLIETRAGNIFFAGDTGAGNMQWANEARRFGPIRLAMIPIGAFRFNPGQMSNDAHIGPEQAVEVLERLGASTAIPIHWGTFRLSNEAYDTPPAMLKLFTACAGIAHERFAPLAIGQAINVAPYSAPARAKADSRPCLPNSPQLAALK
ncbi:MAG: MBL fold metallo-hydrolase [Sphingobium sp.]